MKKNLKLIILILIIVVLFIATYLLYNNLSKNYNADNLAQANKTESVSQESENQESSSKQKAPDFTALDSNSKEVKFTDYKGKPIVLNLWASWCGPCKQEMPHFEKAFKENQDVQFLMVNVTSGDNKSDAEKLIKDEGYSFEVLYDIYGEAANAYQASSLPMTIFIDKDGYLITYAVGALDAQMLSKGIEMIK